MKVILVTLLALFIFIGSCNSRTDHTKVQGDTKFSSSISDTDTTVFDSTWVDSLDTDTTDTSYIN